MAYLSGNQFEAEHRIGRRIEQARAARLADEAQLAEPAYTQPEVVQRRPSVIEMKHQLALAQIGLIQAGIQIAEPRPHVYVHQEQ